MPCKCCNCVFSFGDYVFIHFLNIAQVRIYGLRSTDNHFKHMLWSRKVRETVSRTINSFLSRMQLFLITFSFSIEQQVYLLCVSSFLNRFGFLIFFNTNLLLTCLSLLFDGNIIFCIHWLITRTNLSKKYFWKRKRLMYLICFYVYSNRDLKS